jgi:two-component system NtrC family sensor kinase
MGISFETLLQKTRRVGAGELDGPLEVMNADPLRPLAVALNAMCDQLSAARDRARIEALARVAAIEEHARSQRSIGIERLASGVAHELGTPMNVVAVRAELIIELATSADVISSAKVIKTQIDAMANLVRRMLDFARRTPPRKGRFDLGRLISRACESVRSGSEGAAISVQFDDPPNSCFIEADPEQIECALRNLLINATQALPDGGNICINLERGNSKSRWQRASVPSGDCARIQVRDDGVGISKDALPRIFDPFFSTRRGGEGAGLGLSVANWIVEDHGGWIEVESKLDEGSTFSVFLPLLPAAI